MSRGHTSRLGHGTADADYNDDVGKQNYFAKFNYLCLQLSLCQESFPNWKEIFKELIAFLLLRVTELKECALADLAFIEIEFWKLWENYINICLF